MARLLPPAPAIRLLGADGLPLHRFEIPFIQWLPDGTSTGRPIARGPETYALAAKFMASGGRYSCVVGLDGNGREMAELVAGYALDDGRPGEMLAVADETVENGPGIGAAVDRLVAASVANMQKYRLERTA